LNKKLIDCYDFPNYKCVTPSWDNDARKKGKGFIFQNSSPDLYAQWLSEVIEQEQKNKREPLVFVNAWNEWAEGAILEPSTHLGHAVLNRTLETLSKHSSKHTNFLKNPPYNISRTKDKKLAVVVHLYYVDLWPQIKEKLEIIKEPFDLFVTLNERDGDFDPQLTNSKTTCYKYVSPNRGRDVLPFIFVLNRVVGAGYEYILKIHSKKSKHRADGTDWFSEMLDLLIPNEETVSNIVTTLKDKSTGIVGPEGHLVSLKRHMGSNAPILYHLLARIYGENVAEKVLSNPEKYPFFGGTMFWARVDVLAPLQSLYLLPDDFQSEHGQIDGTTAHAVERLFGAISRCENRQQYLVSLSGVKIVEDIMYQDKYKFAP
jgi:lipopolysaccharide biosynthesis protein